jgi:insertion element IS1 protein InsB
MQNFKCKECSKQFQSQYLYQGADKRIKDKLLQMQLRGCGIRDTALLAGVSPATVLSCIISESLQITIKPLKRYYHKVQIDEVWSFVGNKQKKVWLLYAYCAETDEILAFAMGKRNSKTVRNLLLKLKGLEIDFFLTDDWKAFKAELPYYQHLIGKQFTKAIEGVNTWFRTRLRRLVRRTTCFSKRLLYHHAIIKLAIFKRNERASYI